MPYLTLAPLVLNFHFLYLLGFLLLLIDYVHNLSQRLRYVARMDLLESKFMQGGVALVTTGFMAFLKFCLSTSQVFAVLFHRVLSTDLLPVLVSTVVSVNVHGLEATLVVLEGSSPVMVGLVMSLVGLTSMLSLRVSEFLTLADASWHSFHCW